MTLDRATFLAAALAPLGRRDPFAAIEEHYGGWIGVVAFEVGSTRRIAHRGDERFPLASTWKLPLVMNVLAGTLGGPGSVSAYLRSIGVRDVRIDRPERSLPSSASRAEPRDTATPSAMANLVARLAGDSPLSPGSTERLLRWMRATTTGDRRLRVGVPRGWHVADKTGSYANVANDVGLLYPPSGRPIAIAAYTLDVRGELGGSRAIADAARATVRSLTVTA